MAENIGTAYLNVEVRTDDMQAGISTAKRSVSDFSQQAQAQFNSLSATQRRAAESALHFAQTIGKSREEVRALSVEQRVGGQLGKELAANIRAQAAAQKELATAQKHAASASAAALAAESRAAAESVARRERLAGFVGSARGQRILDSEGARGAAAELSRFTVASGRAAMSAKELAFATRGLPAQFTDIAVSLQAGQSPLTVLLQQGGQIKDQFGGVGAAARAMGGYIAGLINPFTLAAAAAATLGMAWKSAGSEEEAFSRAVIQSGSSADSSVEALRAMAAELDRSTSATAGKASRVLAEVVATGRFTAEEILKVAKAAIQMEDALGVATEKTIQDFVKLKEAPSEYIQKLNEAGVVNGFLTEETLKSTRELEKQGQQAEAVRTAMDAYGGTVETVSTQVVGNLSVWSSFWRTVTSDATHAFDKIVDGFRNSAIAQAQFFRSMALGAGAVSPVTGGLTNSLTDLSLKRQAAAHAKATVAVDPYAFLHNPRAPTAGSASGIVDPETQKARDEFERDGLRYASERVRSKREEAAVQALVKRGVIDQAEAERRIADIRKSYADKAPKARKPGKSDAEREAEQLERSYQSLAAQMARQIALHGQVGQAAQVSYDVQSGALKGLDGARKASLVDQARQIDLNKLEEAGLEKLARRAEEKAGAEVAVLSSRQDLIADLQFEIELIGKSALQQAQMIELRRAGVEANSEYGQSIMALVEKQYMLAEQQQIFDAVRSSVSDLFMSFADGSQSAGDAFEDFTKRIRRLAAELAMSQAMKALGNWGQANAGAGGWQGTAANILSSLLGSPKANANGGVYSSPSLSAYSGQVVDKPTLFAFAKGAGLMGEAGPEAIMPLRRGRDGKLGVAAAGGGGMQVEIHNHTNSRVEARTETKRGPDGEMLERLVVKIVAANLAGGGEIAAAGKSRFDWRDRM